MEYLDYGNIDYMFEIRISITFQAKPHNVYTHIKLF